MHWPLLIRHCPGFGGPNDDEKRFVQLLHGELEKVGARVHVLRIAECEGWILFKMA